MELLIRAHSSLAFGLLREPGFVERFGAALRQLGLRGIEQRLDEVPSSVMAEPIPGPTNGRKHRDDLPAEQRFDADGRPLPPPPGLLLSHVPASAVSRAACVGVDAESQPVTDARRQRRLQVGRGQQLPA